jgi:hypothetical protein
MQALEPRRWIGQALRIILNLPRGQLQPNSDGEDKSSISAVLVYQRMDISPAHVDAGGGSDLERRAGAGLPVIVS